MSDETLLTNAHLVLPDGVVLGSVLLRGDIIIEVQPGRSGLSAAHDLDGDYLIPGAVDVHTDNLERQVQPRAMARWPSRSAMVAHDAQCAAAGVTTVFDALCLGDLGFDKDRMRTFQDGVTDLDALADCRSAEGRALPAPALRSAGADMLALFDPVADHPRVRMVSLMDHSPGVGQYANLDLYRDAAAPRRAR